MTTSPTAPPSATEGHDVRLADAWDALRTPSLTVVSTDVFDTLLWRTVDEPVDAFPLIGARLREQGALSPALHPAAFGNLRRSAERIARGLRDQRLGEPEVTLEEIYARIPAWVFNGGLRAEQAADVEVEVEAGILVPDLDVLELLDAAQRADKRIVAISDTYFSPAQLRRLFDQPVLGRLLFDAVFTSSEHRRNKSGGLFDIALRELGVDGDAVLHIGDNPEADGRFARAAGLRPVAFERRPAAVAAVRELELRLRPEPARSRPVASGLTAARSKVLSRPEVADVPRGLLGHWHYGATVLGPVFTGFADWLIDSCERIGAPVLGCLMREGAFLSELVSRAAQSRDLTVEARPLWLNRAVCLRAGISAVDPDALAALVSGRSPATVSSVVERLGLRMSSLPAWASHADTTLDDPTVRMNLIAAIGEDDALRHAVLDGARVLRERVAGLVERTFPAGAPAVVADLGWGGTIQGLLTGVLAEAGAPRHVVGLYLLTHVGATDQVIHTGTELHGFLGDLGIPADTIELVMRAPELLEQVCMPQEGSQLDLDAAGEPVCAENGVPLLQRAEAAAVRAGIFAFQREWSRYRSALPGRLPRLSDATEELRPILLRAVTAPTSDEVQTFAAWQHDENRGTERLDPIVSAADVERARYMDPDQARRLPMETLYWPYALATQVDAHWSQLMLAASAGQIPWEALGAPLDTGHFGIEPSGVGLAPDAALHVVPTRNRLGLSCVSGTLRGSHIQRLTLRPASTPAVVRIDRIELRCWRQGEPEPLEVVLDDLHALERANCFVVTPNLVLVHSGAGELRLDVSASTPRIVYRVDVEVAFAAFSVPELLVGEGRFGNLEEAGEVLAAVEAELAAARRALDDLQGSASWKATAPLRRAKRLWS